MIATVPTPRLGQIRIKEALLGGGVIVVLTTPETTFLAEVDELDIIDERRSDEEE